MIDDLLHQGRNAEYLSVSAIVLYKMLGLIVAFLVSWYFSVENLLTNLLIIIFNF